MGTVKYSSVLPAEPWPLQRTVCTPRTNRADRKMLEGMYLPLGSWGKKIVSHRTPKQRVLISAARLPLPSAAIPARSIPWSCPGCPEIQKIPRGSVRRETETARKKLPRELGVNCPRAWLLKARTRYHPRAITLLLYL